MTKREVARMEEAREVVTLLGEVDWPEDGEHIPEDAARAVLEIMKGREAGLFRLLDEKPGHSWWNGYDGTAGTWHWKLRRVRNARGRDLEAVLDTKSEARRHRRRVAARARRDAYRSLGMVRTRSGGWE